MSICSCGSHCTERNIERLQRAATKLAKKFKRSIIQYTTVEIKLHNIGEKKREENSLQKLLPKEWRKLIEMIYSSGHKI